MVENPILKREYLLLQLNPWNNRDKVSVANAMVLATAGLPVFRLRLKYPASEALKGNFL